MPVYFHRLSGDCIALLLFLDMMRQSPYLFLLLLLLSATLLSAPAAADQSKDYDDAALTAKCQGSLHPDLCLEGARRIAAITGTTTIDDKTMAKLMLAATMVGTLNITDLADVVFDNSTLSPAQAKIVEDCGKNRFNNARGYLTQAAEALENDDGDTAASSVLDAMGEYSHCGNVLDDPKYEAPTTPISRPVSLLYNQASVALKFIRSGYDIAPPPMHPSTKKSGDGEEL